MDVSVTFQILTVAVSIAVGFVLGVVRMLVGIIMSIFGRNKLLVALCDVGGWIFAAFVTYCLLLVFTYGNVRGYVLFFELLGVSLYCFTFGRLKATVEKTVYLKSKAFFYRIKEYVKNKQKDAELFDIEAEPPTNEKNIKKFAKKRKKIQKSTCKN